MIEFLPPRDDAFGAQDVAGLVRSDDEADGDWGDEAPRSRWSTVLAVVGVTGLLAGGVVAASPWDDPRAAPTPTTSPPAATEPRTTTTTAAAAEPTLPRDVPTSPAGWIPIEGTSVHLAYAHSMGVDLQVVASGVPAVLVYASDDATQRTSGRWLAIDPEPLSMSTAGLRRGAVDVSSGGRRMLVSSAGDGTVTLDVELFQSPSARPLTITSFGIPLDALLVVAETVEVVWEGNVRSLDLSGALQRGVLDGLSLRWDAPLIRWSPGNAFGTTIASSDVVDVRTAIWSRIDVVRPDAARRAIGRLLDVVPVAVDELPVELQRRLDDLARTGRQIELGRFEEVSFTTARVPLVDGHELVVATAGDVDDLLDLVESIRPASDAEWVDLVTRGYHEGFDAPAIEVDQLHVPLGSGDDWSADLWADQGDSGRFSLATAVGYLEEPFEHGQGPELVEYRSLAEVFVRATTTFPSEARVVEVVQEGLAPRRAELHEITGTGVLAAVVRLDPSLPYTVVWSDADGNLVEGPRDAAASTAASGATA